MSFRGFVAAAAVLAVTTLAILPAAAHGPTRQRVTDTIEINAPADKVWAVIGNFGDMSWHPFFTSTEVVGGNEVGAERSMKTVTGTTVKQKLVKYDAAKMALQYEITENDIKFQPVTGYESWLTVKPNGDKTTVEWRGKFYRGFVNNDPPLELNDDAAIAAVTVEYRKGLESLKAKIEGGASQ